MTKIFECKYYIWKGFAGTSSINFICSLKFEIDLRRYFNFILSMAKLLYLCTYFQAARLLLLLKEES